MDERLISQSEVDDLLRIHEIIRPDDQDSQSDNDELQRVSQH